MGMFAKIFAVLNVIMASVLVGMVAVYVANVDDVQSKLAEERNKSKALEQSARQRDVEALERVALANTQVQQLGAQIEQLQSEIRVASQRFSSAQAEIVGLNAENASYKKDLALLSSAEKTNSDLNKSLTDRVETLGELNTANRAKILELDLRLTEEKVKADSYAHQVRFLKEEIAALERQNLDLAGGGAKPSQAIASSAQPTSSAPKGITATGLKPQFPIRGSVTAVDDINGIVFIEMNVGSNDGVATGMEFTVYEGETFLGRAFVTITDLNSSAAEVHNIKGKITPNRAEVLAGGQP